MREKLIEREKIITERYGIDVTPLLIKKDDRGWYSQLRLHYFLTVGDIYLANYDKEFYARTREGGESRRFEPDINKKELSEQIVVLKLLNIERFLDLEAEFTKESLSQWLSFAIEVSSDAEIFLGVSINCDRDSAIAVAQRILKKIGAKLEFKCWRGGRKNKHRVYSGSKHMSDEILQIFEFWNSKKGNLD